MNRTGYALAAVVASTGPDPVGIVMPVVAQMTHSTDGERLRLVGRTRFEKPVVDHLRQVVLPGVDAVLEDLEIKPSCFTVGLIDTSGSVDAGVTITGHSADTAVFLAMLSVATGIPVAQDLLSTGHMATTAGDIVPVSHLAAKVSAASADPRVSTIACPSDAAAYAQWQLRPGDAEAGQRALRQARGQVRVERIEHAIQLVRIGFDAADIAQASLQQGFLDGEVGGDRRVGAIAAYLQQNNDSRYWCALRTSISGQDVARAHGLIRDRLTYTQAKGYRAGDGVQLQQLLAGLPPLALRAEHLFPLAEEDLVIGATANARAEDAQDVDLLRVAVLGQQILADQALPPDAALEYITQRLQETSLASRVDQHFLQARQTYRFAQIQVRDAGEFAQIICSYYTHVIGQCGAGQVEGRSGTMQQEAYEVVVAAFGGGGRAYDEAVQEARRCNTGGMPCVLDRMTQVLITRAQDAYAKQVFRDAIDPLDPVLRSQVLQALFDRMREVLPASLADQPAYLLEDRCEEVILAYVRACSRLSQALHTI